MRFFVLKKFTVIIFTLLLLMGFLSAVQAQKTNDESNKKNVLREKIYVHTDRSSYICGDIIWFKVYVTDPVNHQPLSISKVVYVEVINRQQKPMLQAKIAIKNGIGSGSFQLPYSVTSDNYQFRAYTTLMKNFSAEEYFQKTIAIINTSVPQVTSTINRNPVYTADFFPEGGQMVNGMESKIAFKLTDGRQNGISGEGVITNSKNDTLVKFTTGEMGMANFMLKPVSGETHTASIRFKDGVSLNKTLPTALSEGFVMNVSDLNTGDVKISVQGNVPSTNEQPVYIVIQQQNKPYLARTNTIHNGQTSFTVSNDSLRSGLSMITVFNAARQPVCERLYFKMPENKMNVITKPSGKSFRLRDPVSIDVSTSNSGQQPLPANMSVSVYRLDDNQTADDENIFTNLWLTCGLRGKVEHAEYYFANPSDRETLNNLLLTQGWSTFSTSSKYNPVAEYKGHIITGRVTYEATKAPAAGILIYLSVPGKRLQLHGCLSDSDGMVHFDMKDFYGPNQVVMQAATAPEAALHMEIYSPFSEKYSSSTLPALYTANNFSESQRRANAHMEVQTAYFENQLHSFYSPSVDSTPFYFKPYKTYLLGDYTRFTTMEEVMREYVQEVNVRKSGSQFRFMTFNAPAFEIKTKQVTETIFEKNPLVLLDGVPVTNINKIIAYDPLKVEKLDVVAERYHYGSISADGILNYTTYKGTLEGYTLDPNDLIIDYEGLQAQRVFYSPQYLTDKERNSRLPDFRDVLYWSPTVSTGADGKARISFYTGDAPGKYVAVIEGVSQDGSAGSETIYFDVVR